MPRKSGATPPARLSPAEFRAKWPATRDADYHDLISVEEAAAILGCTDTYVRKMVRLGKLKGKVLTQRSYVISLADAKANSLRYALTGQRRGRGPGRPRSKA